jgi:dipeptidyl aminopeptidase/acylaminoacyl peptidase
LRIISVGIGAVIALTACGGGRDVVGVPPFKEDHTGLITESIPYDAIGPNKIVFHRDISDPEKEGIVLIDGAAQNISTTFSYYGMEARIQPGGTRIVYVGPAPISETNQRFAEVYVRDWASDSPTALLGPGGRRSVPSWSPDGSKVLFGEVDEYGLTPFIRIVSQSPVANASDRQILWSAGGKCEYADLPVQTQNGDIAFVYYPGTSPTCSLAQTIAVKSAGGSPRIVYGSQVGHLYAPAWSPSGSDIAFFENDAQQTPSDGIVRIHLNVVAADGSNLRTFAIPPGVDPSTGDPSLCWARDGSRIFLALGATHTTGHIYSINASGGALTQITTANATDRWLSCE